MLKLDSTAQAALDGLLRANVLETERAFAHVCGLLPPGECGAWDVDLDVPRFTERIKGTVHVEGSAQLIATWSARDGTWLWSDHNPSISATGHQQLMEKLAAIQELRPLRNAPRFAIERMAAVRLASWCALRAGWVGAWPGDTGDAVALLALDPTVWPGSPNPVQDRLWCTFCGRTRREAPALISGPGVCICDQCVRKIAAMLEEVGERWDDGSRALDEWPCVFCGGQSPRLFAPFAAICRECIATCSKMLG